MLRSYSSITLLIKSSSGSTTVPFTHEHPKCLKELFIRSCLWRLKRRLSVLGAGEELSSLSELPVFHASWFSPANSHCDSEIEAWQVSLGWVASRYSRQSCTVVTNAVNILTECQKVGKQHSLTRASLVTRNPSTVHLIPLLPPQLLIPLQISVTEAENTRFSRLDASTDRKNKVNWALRQDD